MTSELIPDFINSRVLYSGLCDPYIDFDWVAFQKGLNGKSINPSLFESNRLGKQIEDYFKTCVLHHPDYELIASNIQVFGENRTLGEFDFLLRKGSKVIHVELVYKVYLNLGPLGFIGPNNNDSLARKRSHLKKNQLSLSNNPYGRDALIGIGLDPDLIESQVLFLGQLYQDQQGSKSELGDNVIYDGTWSCRDELTFAGDSSFYVPQKKFWVTRPKDEIAWIQGTKAMSEIDLCLEKKRSVMIWEKTSLGNIKKRFVTWFS